MKGYAGSRTPPIKPGNENTLGQGRKAFAGRTRRQNPFLQILRHLAREHEVTLLSYYGRHRNVEYEAAITQQLPRAEILHTAAPGTLAQSLDYIFRPHVTFWISSSADTLETPPLKSGSSGRIIIRCCSERSWVPGTMVTPEPGDLPLCTCEAKLLKLDFSVFCTVVIRLNTASPLFTCGLPKLGSLVMRSSMTAMTTRIQPQAIFEGRH